MGTNPAFYIAAYPARVLNRFLEWLFNAESPFVVYVRELIRRNDALLFCARMFIRAVRGIPALPRRLKASFPSQRRLRAVLQARAIGGAINLAELEQIWHLKTSRHMRVFCIAEGLEREQIEIMLLARGIQAKYYRRRRIDSRSRCR